MFAGVPLFDCLYLVLACIYEPRVLIEVTIISLLFQAAVKREMSWAQVPKHYNSVPICATIIPHAFHLNTERRGVIINVNSHLRVHIH